MGLCKACVRFTQKLLQWLIHEPSTGSGWIGEKHLPFPKILSSAPSCDLCYLLKESCMRKFRAIDEESPSEEAFLDYVKAWKRNELLYLELSMDSKSKKVDHLYICSMSVGFEWNLQIWAATGSLLNRRGRINCVPPIRQDDSEESYDLIHAWFSECRENHPRCCTTTSNYPIDEDLIKLPARVIDVSPDEDPGYVVLIKTNGQRGHYAALSHCWGPPSKKPLQTTKETLSQHERGIEIKKLPKTFRDAVMVTREIGIRYLWIDSLCIVQQDKAEWNHEVLRMGEIFENAQVVIAATTARDSSEGLFMSGRHLTDPIVKLPSRFHEDNRDQEVMVSFSAPVPPFEKDCLWDRAWTFQEKHLARRMLIFGKSGIFWTCKSTREIFGDRGRSYGKWNPLGRNWLGDVEGYCWKGLTYESDRLVAIEGLVRELEKIRSDTYESGVWSSEAHKSFSWIVQRPGEGVSSGSRVPGIPSWSWASVTGSKTFAIESRAFSHFRPKEKKVITFNGGNVLSVTSYLKPASLSPGCRCLSNKEAFFERSDSHYESECNQTSSQRDDFWIFSPQETQALNMRGSNAKSIGWAYFDEKSVEDFLCLFLYEVEGEIGFLKNGRGQRPRYDGRLYYIALLLKQVSGMESFGKVGLGLITMSNWFDGEPLLSLSIV